MEAMIPLSILCAFLFMVVVTASYYLCPPRLLGKKYEYVKFFLVFLTLYCAVAFAISGLMWGGDRNLTAMLIVTLFFPLLFLGHWLYKFRTVRKDQHISFFLFFAALLSAAMLGITLLAALCL